MKQGLTDSEGEAMYVVVENTPGYLPEDDDPATFENIEDARVYASDLLSRLLDHLVDCEDDPSEAFAALNISGSFQSDLCVYVTDSRRAHDLGRVIEIIEAPDEQ